MTFRTFIAVILGLALTAGFGPAKASFSTDAPLILEGGGGGKDKKEGAEGEKDDKKKTKLHNPQKSAKRSAKNAIYAMRLTEKEVMARAKVRNFFHKMFNTKPGKTRNFYKQTKRNAKPYR